ncbi:MAG: hypothetical protein ABI614_26265 [Planctomycetota bacterium]
MCCPKRSTSPESRRESYRNAGLNHIAAPTVPCKCPASCWCRCPALAVLQAGELSQVADADEPVVFWHHVADATTTSPVVAAPSIPISAQQVCAVLCRFLA